MITPDGIKDKQGEADENRVAPQPAKEDASLEGASSSADPSPTSTDGPLLKSNSASAAVKELQ